MAQTTGKTNILLVDDRPGNLLTLEALLEPLGQNLITAGSGAEALRHLLTDEFALILMDVQMPRMDGFETATLIKQREKTSHTPIIFITAISKDEEYAFKGYAAGAVDYIAKPFNPEILRSKVAVFVDLFLKTQQVRWQAELLLQAEQREQERQLAKLELKLETYARNIVDTVREPLLMLDSTLRVRSANRAFYETFQASPEETENHFIYELGNGQWNVPTLRTLLEAIVPNNSVFSDFELVHTFPVIGRRAMLLNARRLKAGSQDELIVVGIEDVTERRRAEDEVESARQNAEAANRTKSLFLANMSHELRTPLNAILGYSEMLQEEADDLGLPEFGPDLKKIQGAGKHLLSLINDILDLSKIEAGRMELYLETFDVPGLIGEVVQTIRPLVKANANTLYVTCPADLGVMCADMTKMRQSLFNLLSNAAKFTSGGTISLDVSRAVIEDREWLRFRVSDTGIGITPEQVVNLFQAFSQADTSTTRKYGGTGLGLALTRRFCQLMGGDVTVDSVPGESSTFTIKVPAIVTELQQPGDKSICVGLSPMG